MTSCSSEVNFTKNYTLLYLFLYQFAAVPGSASGQNFSHFTDGTSRPSDWEMDDVAGCRFLVIFL